MEGLIVLVLIGIMWIVSPRRWRKRLISPIAAIALLSVLALSPLGLGLASWGLTHSLPVDSGEAVDAIIVLGRGEEFRHRRLEVVQELWEAKRSPKIFASGMLDAEFVLSRLKEAGIPSSALSGERCSQSTAENALFTSAVLYPQGVRKVLLVTDPPHMLRSLWMFRSYQFSVIPHLSPTPPQHNAPKRLVTMLREYVGLASYKLSGVFEPRTTEQLANPPTEVVEKFSSWNCRLSQP